MKKIKLKPSVVFWNAIVFLIVGISAIVKVEYFFYCCYFATMISFPLFVEYLADALFEPEEGGFVNYWVVFSAIFWCGVVLYLLYRALSLVLSVVGRANDWLDSKFSNK